MRPAQQSWTLLAFFASFLTLFVSVAHAQTNSCFDIFVLDRTEIMTPETTRSLDVGALRATQTAVFEFEIKGLHFLFEVQPKPNRPYEVELVNFVLDYEPSLMSSVSYFRRVLGSKPMQYSMEDVRTFSSNSYYEGGQALSFYLRMPEDPHRQIDDGPLLAVYVKNGKIFGYPARTNVDGAASGIARGSWSAIGQFLKGLSLEAQGSIVAPKGQFYLNENGSVPTIESSGPLTIEGN